MPITKLLGLTSLAKPLTSEEGRRILERDHYRCQYCGLDGMSNFENSLIMTVDFLVPRAKKGKKTPANLVTACRPCNVIKGHRVFPDLAEAKAYVSQRRAELQKDWETNMAQLRSQTEKAIAAKP
jgi:5-methylcytosine-specific restriction endonuclease McrA